MKLLQDRKRIIAGGLGFNLGALAFAAVFNYLATNFDYAGILEGSAAQVIPRLYSGGSAMRAVWAIYAFLPLLLVPGAVGAYFAFPSSRGRMTLALVVASLGALAMCLGLMRWPSIHWALGEAYSQAGAGAKSGIEAVFNGFHLYLGNYIGEFFGEIALGTFFLLTGFSMRVDARFPRWIRLAGIIFPLLFLTGAFRNITSSVRIVSDVNSLLLPLWMIVLGTAIARYSRKPLPAGDPRRATARN